MCRSVFGMDQSTTIPSLLFAPCISSRTPPLFFLAWRPGPSQISGACVIAGLYCEGALVLANIGDCQAVYHGQVKSAPGSPVTAQTVRGRG